MSHINYEGWAAYIADILLEYIPANSRILEIAAGTGVLAGYLGRVFPKIIMSEYSKEMLLEASKKFPKVASDMTSLPFKCSFNAVCSTFDSVNYLTSLAKLNNLFIEIASVLKEGGYFCFDASLENNSKKYISYINTELELPDDIVTQRSWYNPVSRYHYNRFYFREDNGKVTSETHKQKIFHFHTFFEIAGKTGFEVIKCYRAFTHIKGKKSDDRVLFLLRRN